MARKDTEFANQQNAVGLAQCVTCRANQGQLTSPGGTIYQDEFWGLAHTFEPIPMVGWLVLKPLRHVEAFADLTPDEAVAFGLLVRRTTRAMMEILSPTKIYIALFAESPNAAHIHFSLIPRYSDTPEERRGPRAFELLREASVQRRNLGSLEAAEHAATAIRDWLADGP